MGCSAVKEVAQTQGKVTLYACNIALGSSVHMCMEREQVAIDPGSEWIFSEKGVPRGRGKIERFFCSVNELFLQDLPGYSPTGHKGAQATLTSCEEKFRTWLLSDYHNRIHSATRCLPADRWQRGGFFPRMPRSLEQLDLLLLTVRKTRRVQQDGIRFEGYRSIDPTLAGFVKEDVFIAPVPAS
jgi:putative transposase